MNTYIDLRILHLDEEGLNILLEDNGSLPSVKVSEENLDRSVCSKIQELLYATPDEHWRAKTFSSISNLDDSVHICFNIYLNSRSLSKKPLVKYNKNSIELQRFINHKGSK